MSTEQQQAQREPSYSAWRVGVSVLATVFFIGLVVVGATVAMTPAGQTITKYISWLFAADSVQIWWYVTRASGIIAYLLLWFSTILGLAVTSKYIDKMLDRMFTYDFHQFISLLSIAFVLLHILVLTLDRYLPYSVAQILIPFISPYRPFWVGIGVIAFYVILLVTITFYLRKRIGMRSFRVIHYLSLLGYLGAMLHGIYSGTDTPLPSMQILYQVSGLAVLFLTIYWLALVSLRKLETRRQATLLAASVDHKRQAPAR